jgi:hypothetical protein
LPGTEVSVLATANSGAQISILVGDAEHRLKRDQVGRVLVGQLSTEEE